MLHQVVNAPRDIIQSGLRGKQEALPLGEGLLRQLGIGRQIQAPDGNRRSTVRYGIRHAWGNRAWLELPVLE
jgi:hypothetical protein